MATAATYLSVFSALAVPAKSIRQICAIRSHLTKYRSLLTHYTRWVQMTAAGKAVANEA